MNGDDWLVDTNIIIYLVDGDQTVSNLLEDRSVQLSFITKIELLAFKKLKTREEKIIRAIINNAHIIFASYDITESAVKIRKNYNLKIPDAIIAATAKTYNLPLVTADTDFNRLDEVNIIQYKSF